MKTKAKKKLSIPWEKSHAYKEAMLLKVLRAMKHYGYQEWMTNELKQFNISL